MKTARGYINLLNQHIDKENNVLFPLARKASIRCKNRQKLWEGFEMIETQKIGVGKHEEFHKMIESLEKNYLQ